MTGVPTSAGPVHNDPNLALTRHGEKLAPLVRAIPKDADTDLSPELVHDFDELIAIIERAKEAAYQAVNRELIGMHWDIGGFISDRLRTGGWGESVVKQFSAHVQRRYPGIAGFSASNIWSRPIPRKSTT